MLTTTTDREAVAREVLTEVVPLSISSTWNETESRNIVRAMLAFADRLSTPPLAPAARTAEADVRARIIGKARDTLRLVQGCLECNAEDERRWMETIRWLEENA